MPENTNGDFDFFISSILLAHRHSIPSKHIQTVYQQGRPFSGVVYCISGSALYLFEDEQLTLKEGNMIFLPKNCRYRVASGKEGDFLHITVNFEISGIELSRRYNAVADSFDALPLLEKLVTVWSEKKQGFRPYAKAFIYELLYKYLKNLDKTRSTAESTKLLAAKRMLDSRYRENISVTELAAACGFSETHFRRRFNKSFGCSPTEYRLKKRMMLAKELLAAGEFTVAEIAAYTGFEDSAYFSRVFKAKTGLTPSEYINTEKHM